MSLLIPYQEASRSSFCCHWVFWQQHRLREGAHAPLYAVRGARCQGCETATLQLLLTLAELLTLQRDVVIPAKRAARTEASEGTI